MHVLEGHAHAHKLYFIIGRSLIYVVIFYIAGKYLYVAHQHAWVKRMWRPRRAWDSFAKDIFFLLRFPSKDDRSKTLSRGPWWFDNQPIIVKEYREGDDLKSSLFSRILAWMTF